MYFAVRRAPPPGRRQLPLPSASAVENEKITINQEKFAFTSLAVDEWNE